MDKFRFYSDVNFTVFKDYLEERHIEFVETHWDTVEVLQPSHEIEQEAFSLGAERCP